MAHWEFKKDVFELWLEGQYRPRFELMQRRDLRASTDAANTKDQIFINHRARFTVGARWMKRVTFFLQFQDVRRWGLDPNQFQPAGPHFYRGWMEFQLAESISIKAGRMELVYDGKRLLGNADWRPRARSFDAIQLKFEPKQLQLHAIYSKLSNNGDPASEGHLAVAWFRYRALKTFQPSVYYMLHYVPDNKEMRHTTGLFVKGKAVGLSYTGELFLQFGNFEQLGNTRDILAWMGAFSVAYTFAASTKPQIIAWAEFLSGQERGTTDTTLRSFVTTFGNNHKHYGLMDFFLNIPVHTQNAGLVDLGGGARMRPAKNVFLRLDIHYFRLFAPLSNPEGKSVQDLGLEFDLIAKYTMLDGYFSLLGIYGLMIPIPDQAFAALGKGNQLESWIALQAEVKF